MKTNWNLLMKPSITKKQYKILFFIALITFFFIELKAQDTTKVSWTPRVDFVSKFVFRSISLSQTPAIQPQLTMEYKNLAIGVFGSYSFSPNEGNEADWFINYRIGPFTLGFNDYYFTFFDEYGQTSNKFLDYDKDVTNHILEGTLRLDIKSAYLLLSKMFYGLDDHSTYAEIGYNFKYVSPFIGFTGGNGMYNDKASIANIGLSSFKDIQITEKFSIPIGISVCGNPVKETIFFVAAISIK